MFDHPLYGEERDRYIRLSKAVLNCHYYESAAFEQVRAFHCLSLGTPIIAERNSLTQADDVFQQAVTWIDEDTLELFFKQTFGRPEFFEQARMQLKAWRSHDPVEAYAELLAFAAGYFGGHVQHQPEGRHRPTLINLGSGKDYKPNWLNLDVIDRAEPDLVLDLGRPQEFPIRTTTRFGLEIELTPGCIERVYANNVLEHVPDLPCLMGNVLTLLKEGGEIEIEVPYERALTAWQDPTHIRAMNENSWTYYTDWFWYMGWFTHRFDLVASTWLDDRLQACTREHAAFMRVVLRKRETTPYERTVARTMQPGLPPFDADDVGAADKPQVGCDEDITVEGDLIV
jgi:SAM-dependent methyltransferase